MAPLRCCSGRAMLSAMPYEISAAMISPTPNALLAPPSAGSAITTAPPKPDHQPDECAALRQLVREQARHRGDEQRRGAVQHAGERRRHVLLGKRKHAQRKREPQHAERRCSCPIGPGHRPAGRREQGQRQKADRDARERDPVGRHRLQAFGNEQERRAPDHARARPAAPNRRASSSCLLTMAPAQCLGQVNNSV